MTKPLIATDLPAGRVRIYFDGEPTAAFWTSLATIAEMMKAIAPAPAQAPTKPKPKKPRRPAADLQGRAAQAAEAAGIPPTRGPRSDEPDGQR